MSIPKISGQQARELLDIWSGDVEGLTFAQLGADRSYGDLFGAAPALAETVAWLYGSEPNEPYEEWRIEAEFGLRGQVHIADNQDGTVELVTGPYGVATYLKPDEAVEVARALLAAAEEARP